METQINHWQIPSAIQSLLQRSFLSEAKQYFKEPHKISLWNALRSHVYFLRHQFLFIAPTVNFSFASLGSLTRNKLWIGVSVLNSVQKCMSFLPTVLAQIGYYWRKLLEKGSTNDLLYPTYFSCQLFLINGLKRSIWYPASRHRGIFIKTFRVIHRGWLFWRCPAIWWIRNFVGQWTQIVSSRTKKV